MGHQKRIQQYIKEAQQRWQTLSDRIVAIKNDLAIELDGERKIVLQKRLTDLETQRTQLEAELHALKQGIPLPHLREAELAYLDDLLHRYAYWESHYTPLAGTAEVRAAVKDGPRLDLPMPFIPRGTGDNVGFRW